MGGTSSKQRLLAGQHVLITGGSAGIGLGLARLYVAAGCNVSLVARSKERLEEARQQLQALPVQAPQRGAVHAFSADVTDFAQASRSPWPPAPFLRAVPPCATASPTSLDHPPPPHPQVQAAVQAATQLSGPVDVLICNAGSAKPGYFHAQGVEVFEQQMRLNYLGVVHTVKAAYDAMVARGSGHICLVASTMALMGFVGYSSYAPSKWAVRGLGDCLRNEVGRAAARAGSP